MSDKRHALPLPGPSVVAAMNQKVTVPVWHHPRRVRCYRNYALGFKIKEMVVPEYTEIRNKKELGIAEAGQGPSFISRRRVGAAGAVHVTKVCPLRTPESSDTEVDSCGTTELESDDEMPAAPAAGTPSVLITLAK
jgi:hypothetical protein